MPDQLNDPPETGPGPGPGPDAPIADAEVTAYLNRTTADLEARIAELRKETDAEIRAEAQAAGAASADRPVTRTAAEIEQAIAEKIALANYQVLDTGTPGPPHDELAAAALSDPASIEPLLDAGDALAAAAEAHAATNPTPPAADVAETAATMAREIEMARLESALDQAYQARDVAMGRWQEAQALGADPAYMAERLAEYKATNELVDHLDGKLTLLEDATLTVVLEGPGPDTDPPAMEMYAEPEGPRPNRDPDAAALEVDLEDHLGASPAEPDQAAAEFHPETFHHVANPTPENLASMSEALHWRDQQQAHADRLMAEPGYDASAACATAIASRTFPDAHAAAARGPEHSIQGRAHKPKAKVASKVAKRGGRR